MYSKIYIAFTKDDGHWWSRFLHKEIQHCAIIKPLGYNYLVFQKTTGKFDLFTVSDKNDILDKPYKLMGVTQKDSKRGLFMLNTCVGHAKQVLGINKPFILTPYQLYKYLRSQNETPKAT